MISKTKFGIYGGQSIHETLMPAIEELTAGNWCCEGDFVVKRFET